MAVTGVLGYSGKYIARALIGKGVEVVGLTNSWHRENPMNIELFPLSWDDEAKLAESLHGCDVLVNTYWVRFNHADFSHKMAVENTKKLFDAAKKAGVKRIVHTSITNPDRESDLTYFRGKAELEDYLKDLGVPYSILRPAVLFGGEPGEDILLNNIAWALRRFPVVGVFGRGDYKLQPIHVQDFVELAVNEAMRSDDESVIIDAVGNETNTFKQLMQYIGKSIGHERPIINMPAWLAYLGTWVMGVWLHDVMLTRDEVKGLTRNLLFVSTGKLNNKIKLSEYIDSKKDTLGIKYSSELARR